MAKPDFKNAAAKLLEKHASTVQNPGIPELKQPVSQQEQLDSNKQPGIQHQPKLQQQSQPQRPQPPTPAPPTPRPSVTLPPFIESQEDDSSPPPAYNNSKAGLKASIMIGLMTVTTAIMVLVVPETIVGIAGNIGLGIVGGGAFGYIINREI